MSSGQQRLTRGTSGTDSEEVPVPDTAPGAIDSRCRTPVAQRLAAGVRDVVRLRLPAVGAYLSVLRTATAGLAARLDFTLDEIEDLRIAVDEACAMLLPGRGARRRPRLRVRAAARRAAACRSAC